jgi:hypothetical protein
VTAAHEIKPSRSELTQVVRKALGSDTLELTGWRIEQLAGGQGPSTRAVYRVSGATLDDGREISWSVILKITTLSKGSSDPYFADDSHALYWKREALAYQSGLLDDLPAGIVAPRCYGIVEKGASSAWLWLEDLEDVYPSGWPLEQYARASYCLGRFNGAYLAGRPMPDCLWLVQDGSPRGLLNGNVWIRDMIATPDSWEHPLVRSAFPVPVADRLLRLWDEREMLLQILDRVPHTFCHLDAWRNNMVARSRDVHRGGLTLIDWAFPGRAAIGTDAGDLFIESFSLAELNDMEPQVLDRAVFESYLDGLCDAGWTGDARVVRCAYAAFCALKQGCALFWLGDLLNEERQTVWQSIFKRPFADFLFRQARLIYYLLELADEAQALEIAFAHKE